jgi:hypothetical protein
MLKLARIKGFLFLIAFTTVLCPNSLFAAASGIPGYLVISHDNWDNDGNYTITMNMWYGNNGTAWELYENNAMISSSILVDNSPNDQNVEKTFFNKPNGTYSYKCALINSYGKTQSSLITVTVTNSSTVSLRPPDNPTNITNGLNYMYYNGYWTAMPDINTIRSISTGSMSNFDINLYNSEDYFGIRYSGFVEVPFDGEYTFYTSSDDGSKLYIGDTLVVDNDGGHIVQEASGTIALATGKHAIIVDYFNTNGAKELNVMYSGPDIDKQSIPAHSLFKSPLTNSPLNTPVLEKMKPIWKVVFVIYHNIDVTYDYNGNQVHFENTFTDGQVQNAIRYFLSFVDNANYYSNDEVLIQYDIVHSDTPITTLSSYYDGYSLAPENIPDSDVVAPKGKYDSVIVVWPNWKISTGESVPTGGSAGLSWGIALNGMTYCTINCPEMDVIVPYPYNLLSHGYIHEWLHGVCAVGVTRGYSLPEGHSDGGGSHGYVENSYDGWNLFYSDLMLGKVLENGEYKGITPDNWRNGSILGNINNVLYDYYKYNTLYRYTKTGSATWNALEQNVYIGNGSEGNNFIYVPTDFSDNFTFSGRVYIPEKTGSYDSVALALKNNTNSYWISLIYGSTYKNNNSIEIKCNDDDPQGANILVSSGWYTIKANIDYQNNQIQAKTWKDGVNEPEEWQTNRIIDSNWRANQIGFRHYGIGTYVDQLFAISDTQNLITPGQKVGLTGKYYNNTTLDASGLVLTRKDSSIDFDWGLPFSKLNSNAFSVCWEGEIQTLHNEVYTFYTNGDGGVKLWVNNQLLIDQWQDQGLNEYSGKIELLAGVKYPIKLKFVQTTGDADIKLLWCSPTIEKTVITGNNLYPAEIDGGGSGLTGEYFNGTTLDSTFLVLTRTDETVNFDWNDASPATGINDDRFSIRWTGEIEAPEDGTYTFYTITDDGVRLTVNNRLLIDQWVDQDSIEQNGTIDLQAGKKYSIKLEYYENYGGAKARLLWKTPSGYKGIVPKNVLYPAIQ